MFSGFKFALRSLAKSPGFTAIAILILALGIGGNTIIFSLVNGLYLKPLPFPHPEQLINLDETAPKWNLQYTSVRYSDFEAWREQNQSFTSMAVFQGASFNMMSERSTERVSGLRVTHNLLEVYSVQPALGRMFSASEELTGGPTVALIGYQLWKEMFSGDPAVLGRRIMLNGESFEIVGVLPQSASSFPTRAAVWVPFQSKPGSWCLSGIGRLKPGVTVTQANADLLRIHKNQISVSKDNEITSPIIQPVLKRYLGEGGIIAVLLQSCVVVVLLIACANVAGLMLARNLARIPELGLRAALGASRWQLARQILTESLILSIVGAAAGVLLGQWLLTGYLAWLVNQMPPWVHVAMDGQFLAYVVLLVALCTAVAGLIPARHVLGKVDLRSVIGSGTQQSSSMGRIRILRILVIGEVALALTLLLVAGYLGRAFLMVKQIDPGVRPANLITYGIDLTETRYGSDDSIRDFSRQHLERVSALPGVTSVAISTALPFSGWHEGNFFNAEKGIYSGEGAQSPVVLTRLSSAGYFETMGITLVAGRSYTENDGPGVIIINETFARTYWPGENALGKHVRFRGKDTPWLEVIGVAHDVRHYGLETPVRAGVYLPYRMSPKRAFGVVVRTNADPTLLAPTLRSLLREQDSTLSMNGLATMESMIEQTLMLRRMYSGMLITFAVIAITLAAAGLYGIVAYVVGQRMREFGIRLALGAQLQDLIRLVLREGMKLAAIGIAIGLVIGVLTGFAVPQLLMGVNPFDPLVLLVTTLLLGSVVIFASLIPARRATRLNVVDVLRSE